MTFKASWLPGSFARSALACGVVLAGSAAISCGGGTDNPSGSGGSGGSGGAGGSTSTSTSTGGVVDPAVCVGVTCSGHGKCVASGSGAVCTCDTGYVAASPTTCAASDGPTLAGCQMLPSDHIFNTPIDALPVHPLSAQFISTIGPAKIHLDLGLSVDPAVDYYGIPYNIVHSGAAAWTHVQYFVDAALEECDCVDASSGSKHTQVSPCVAEAASQPVFPVPAVPLIEGGISADSSVYGDHHLLMLDADTCHIYELFHVYSHPSDKTWDISGSAIHDLGSNKLRPDGWTSIDAAGFPLLPLLLRADEASTGTIKHALRFTINSDKIRDEYVWPARHTSHSGTAAMALPPMGQVFRLKASYVIPAAFGTQSRAILQALKTYGMYIADGGSDMYLTGAPDAQWTEEIYAQVQSVGSSEFEAVDLTSIHQREGFDLNSAAVPKP